MTGGKVFFSDVKLHLHINGNSMNEPKKWLWWTKKPQLLTNQRNNVSDFPHKFVIVQAKFHFSIWIIHSICNEKALQ
jgi:hypothetical protein